MNKKYVTGAGLLVIGALLGGAAGAIKWRGSAAKFHREARVTAIIDQAGQMPRGGVLVIGDSITEFNRFDVLCGRPALNAGIAWARTKDWLADAKRVVDAAKPSVVVLAIGTNDVDGPEWRSDYTLLGKLSRADFAVRPNIAGSEWVSTILPTVPGPSKLRDGKHPDAAGAAEWRRNIETGCRQFTRPARPMERPDPSASPARPASGR